MRVLQVIDSLVPGGAERSLAAIAPHLVALGVELDVVALSSTPGLEGELRQAGCRVVQIAGSGRIASFVALRRHIGDARPDLVHTTLFESDVLGRPAARLTGTAVVTTLANEAYGPRQRAALPNWKVTATQLLDAATARLATRFHAVSPSVASTMGQRLRIPAGRIDVIPRGRDAGALGRRTRERRDAARRSLGLHDDVAVLAVGRHEHQKGLDVLVDAVADLDARGRRVSLLVAGREGAATPDLRAKITAHGLGDRVRLLGARHDVADLLCAVDVFVLASRWEGLPGAVIEAMALEVPIVATSIGGALDALGADPPARLVPVDDVGALAVAISRAVDEGTDTAAARARFEEHFTIEHVAARMARFYERATSPSEAS